MANLKDLIVNGAARIIGKTYSSEFVGKLTGDVTGNVTGNLTGNVTGNVSGSSGSCTGNAATSSKLKTAVSLTTTDGTNTSDGVGFDGSADVALNLPSTIKATFSGNLTGDVTGNVSGSSGSCTGNAATATKATNDSADQQINTTYIKGLSADGRTITYTRGDNSTDTITTQDTTYSNKTAASGGTDVSLVTTGEKYTWNSKADGSHTHNYAGSASVGGSATSSQALDGFSRQTSQTWGVQTGTFVHGEGVDGCDWGFRKDCPSSGMVSLVVDGKFYQNEGRYACIDTSGGTITGTLTASKVWGAVFNDLADAIPVGEGDILEAGYCYGFDGEHYTKTSEYMQKSYIGIHSDTYGFKMGHEEGKEKLNVAVSGFVLAYVDKEYEVGTPLTCTADGCLTEIKLEDKIKYPERVVATYWKNEPNEEWGPEGKKVKVNGRRWVKVK